MKFVVCTVKKISSKEISEKVAVEFQQFGHADISPNVLLQTKFGSPGGGLPEKKDSKLEVQQIHKKISSNFVVDHLADSGPSGCFRHHVTFKL